jgi:hypothetical protein
MAIDIGTFKEGAMKSGGFRPTLFSIESATLDRDFSLLCNASQVPAMTMGVIEIPYFGRKIKVAGDRTYAEWTTTVFIEEDFSVRDKLENWQKAINDPTTNVRDALFNDYKDQCTVSLYGKNGKVIRTYTLQGCWPTEVGTIELDWNTTDTLATYQVTWAFDILEPGNQKGTSSSNRFTQNQPGPKPAIQTA